MHKISSYCICLCSWVQLFWVWTKITLKYDWTFQEWHANISYWIKIALVLGLDQKHFQHIAGLKIISEQAALSLPSGNIVVYLLIWSMFLQTFRQSETPSPTWEMKHWLLFNVGLDFFKQRNSFRLFITLYRLQHQFIAKWHKNNK
jgi:hypothetical protein